MLVIKNQVHIKCSLEKVFSFVANPENFPKWNYYLQAVQKIENGNPVTGSVYRQVRKKDELYYMITAIKENEFIEFKSVRSRFLKFKRQFTFSVSTDGCIIDDLFEIRTWLPSFINIQLAKKPQKAVNENLLKLKQLLETGETILQDGKKSGLT